jgi:hypothetical protein
VVVPWLSCFALLCCACFAFALLLLALACFGLLWLALARFGLLFACFACRAQPSNLCSEMELMTFFFFLGFRCGVRVVS